MIAAGGPPWSELGARSVAAALEFLPFGLALVVVGALAAMVARDRPRLVGRALLGGALVAGAVLVVQRASIVDDAFISFRHAANLQHGQGLVWNPGERVEGVTNLGWTLLLALGSAVLPVRIEHVAVVGCAMSWLGVVALTAVVSKQLHDAPDSPPGPWIPLAAALVAVHPFTTGFATTGLETEFAALLLLCGITSWLRDRPGLASLFWILATVVRLDQALFWAMGSVAVAVEAWPRRDVLRVARYLAPLGLLAVVLLGKLAYYGDVMPNTYYAKSAGQTYLSYGAFYTAASYLAGNLWLHLPLAGAWLGLARGREQRFAALLGAMGVLWHAYVLKVGGDFMLGRFFVGVVPLLLLAAERAVVAVRERSAVASGAIAAVLVGGALGIPVVRPGQIEMGLADEGSIYPISSWSPLVIDHANFHAGQMFGTYLHDRGLDVPLATSGIGMIGFYSELTVIDILGLTDPVVAHQPVTKRGRPGHEKRPPPGYLDERGVVLERTRARGRWDSLREVGLPPPWRSRRRWLLRRYDASLMERWRRDAPEIRVVDFDRYYEDRFRPSLPHRSVAELEADLAFLDRFYWSINGADERRSELVDYLADRRAADRAATRE